MASLTGQLVAETYKALLKLIDNDILTASEKQITDGFGGGSNVFIDSQGFLRANKYKITNGLATQFLKADGSLDSNAYLTSITGAQVITALGYTPVPTTRTITINGETHNLAADNSWTVGGTSAIWGNITGTLSNQTDLQNALNAKFDDPTGTISQYIRGDGSIANFPALTGYVPYSGATSNVNLGEYGLTAGFLGFDTTPTGTPTGIGTMYWDAPNRTISLIDGDGDTTLQIGQEERVLVHNNTGATLTDGQVVYVTGSTGELPSVALASNTAEATSSVTLGVVTESIAHGADGFITTSGIVHGLNTLAFTEGAAIYLGSTPGTFTQTKPVAPNNLVLIGYIIKKAGGNGSIFVKIQNGYELDELHDVYITDPANNHGLFYDIADGLWKNKSIATALGYTPQAQLSGTGFVKASGTTITYDNSTYLTTTDAASTYQRLDKMVSNLLPSATEYPNSNAVIAALALKADAANPVFTGNMTISGAEPKLYFTDTDQNPDYFIGVDAGFFRVYDQTAGATRFVINSDGNISTGVGKSITAGSFIKDGGTATQFLKADGSVDTTDYATVASLANYLLSATAASTYQTLANLSTDLTASATKYPSVNAVNTGLGTKQPLDADLTAIAGLTGTSGFLKKTAADTWTLDTSTYLTTGDASTTYLAITTAASTYQRLDKMVSNLLPSSTEYPNSNAVINALALKANAANPVFTGDLSISGATPRLYFVDTDQNPDYTVFIDSGYFYIYDQTAGATRFSINSSGNINTGVGKSITAGSFIKESGTSSQFLMADGSVSTGVANTITGSLTSGYIPKAIGANTLGNSLLYENGTKVFIGTTTTNSISTGGLTLSNATSSSLVLYNGAVIGFIYGSSVAAGMAVSSDYDLRFETGDGSGSNWPERMRLFRSTGNLSLGNGGSPADSGYKLDVNGSVKFSNILDVSGNITLGNGTLFVSAGSGQSYSGRLSVVYSYPYIDTYLDSYAGASHESRLNFRTNSGGGAMSTKMTINNTGYVGIGVTTPGGFLHVKGQFESYYGLILEGTYGTGHQYGWKTNGGNSDVLSLYSITNNGRLAGFGYYESFIQVNGSIRFYISSGGNVLIGTTTDSGYKLDVNGSLRINGVNPSITTDSATDYTIINARKNGTRTWQIDSVGGSYWLYMQGLGAYAMQIASSTGYVGLGTSNPTGTLHIYNSNPAFRIQNSLGGNLQFGQWDSVNNRIEGSGGLPMFITSYSQPIKFGIDGSENMRLSTSGSLGIGTTNPLMQIHSSKAGGNGIFVSNTTSNTGGYLYASTYTFQLQATDSANSSVGTLSLQPFGGNVLIGTGTDNGARLRVVGGTIDFAGDTRYGVARIYNASVGDMFGMEQVGTTQTGTSGAATRIFTAYSNGNFLSLGWYTTATAFTDALKIACTSGAATFMNTVTATSFFESSDFRLKTLIENNPIINGIEKLEAKLYQKNGKIELGYFAQDAELIMPYAVTKNEDGFLNLSYREVHTAKIARLEQRVAELEKQLNVA